MKKPYEHNVIRTPSDTINVIGAGGILQGYITELWGNPMAGKSAFSYNTGSFFLEDYPDGLIKIVDSEISTDTNRLENAFMMDLDRVIIDKPITLEEAYASIFDVFAKLEAQKEADIPVADFIESFSDKLADKLMAKADVDYDLDQIFGAPNEEKAIYELQKLANLLAYHGQLKPIRPTPVFLLWDTIAASKPAKEVEAALKGEDAVNAGGLGFRARINETHFSILMTQLAKHPSVTVFVLNQVRKTNFGGGPNNPVRDTSSGGNVLKHNAHYRFHFKSPKKVFDDELMMDIGTMSMIDVEKSKFGPTVKNIPIWVDDRLGGVIIQREEVVLMCNELNIIKHHNKGWWRFKGEDISYRWDRADNQDEDDNYLVGNPDSRLKCIDRLAHHFRRNFARTLDTIYTKIGMTQGELTQEEREEAQNLANTFSLKDVLRNLTPKDDKATDDDSEPVSLESVAERLAEEAGDDNPSETTEQDSGETNNV